MRDLVVLLVRGLVREPQKVRVHEHEFEGRSVFEVSVSPADIGREEHTANTMRTLLDALARRRGGSCALEVLD